LAVALGLAAGCHMSAPQPSLGDDLGGKGDGPRTGLPAQPPFFDFAGPTDGGSPIDAYLLAKMAAAQVPGMAVVAVKNDQIVFSGAYGLADVSTMRPVTLDTIFNVASISKTVTATALMQLIEHGQFGLDEDVDDALPFRARNPSYPARSITPRMLLSHTAGTRDTASLYSDYLVYGHDSVIALVDFMRGFLVPGGAYYQAANWRATAPGTSYLYSDISIDLAGELAEAIARQSTPGASLETYCQGSIFAPLGMNETSWFLDGLTPNHVAQPYTIDASGNFVTMGPYCYPDYPNGQLRTSATQLARFLMMMIGHGSYGTTQILSASTTTEMLTQQPNSLEGLAWEYFSFGGRAVVGHSGIDVGVSTDMWFDPATGAGFVLLTNGDVYLAHHANFLSGPPYVVPIQAMVDIATQLLGIAESS
jgi:CubicO group peptidase (beta-lactamase class C family)